MTQWLLLSDFCFLLDAFLVFHVFGDRTLINIEIRKKSVFFVTLKDLDYGRTLELFLSSSPSKR